MGISALFAANCNTSFFVSLTNMEARGSSLSPVSSLSFKELSYDQFIYRTIKFLSHFAYY